MSQVFQDTPATEKVRESRPKLLARDEALRSSFSGTAFPTDPAPVAGQVCFRTDLLREFRYNGTDWEPNERSKSRPDLLDFIPPQYHSAILAFTSTQDVTEFLQDAFDGVGNYNQLTGRGRYRVSANVNVTKAVGLMGPSKLGLVIDPLDGFSASADVLTWTPDPAIDHSGLELANFSVGRHGANARLGRDAIRLDTQVAGARIPGLIVRNVLTGEHADGSAWGINHINNTTNNPEGGIYKALFQGCELKSSLRLYRSGDSITWLGGGMSGKGAFVVDLTTGATQLLVHGANLTPHGCTVLHSGIHITFSSCIVELVDAANTNSNDALIDAIGDVATLQELNLIGNVYYAGNLSGITKCINLGATQNANVERESFRGDGATSAVGLYISENADATRYARLRAVDAQITAAVDDDGTNSVDGDDVGGGDVPSSRLISAGGMATGGGDLSADRTITVTEATAVQARAMSSSAVAITPARLQSMGVLRGLLTGMTLANNGTDATNDIDFAAGYAADSTGAEIIQCAALTKRLDAAWAAGTNQGGLDTGTVANGTYNCFAIKKDSDGSGDFLFSLSPTAPTMPSGYTKFRRIGSIVRAAGAILAFTQYGDEFLLSVSSEDIAANNPGTGANLGALLACPTGIDIIGIFDASLSDNSPEEVTWCFISSPSMNDTAPTALHSNLATPNITNAAVAAGRFRIRLNTSRQIRWRLSSSTADHYFYASTAGWVDRRGRD